MKVKIFVDWDEQEVISEAEYKERIRQESEKRMADKEYFHEWLGDNYTPQAIWELTEAGRIEVQGLWERECKDTVEVESDFVMTEIEI
jgi:hypothetical protein